ncbi:MAG: peptide deformylase [Trueperaceae bacterium]
MIYQVRLYGDPVLRKVATPVTVFDNRLKQLAHNMIETMYYHNGIGLAAPQVGISKRMFVACEFDQKLREDSKNDDENPPQTMAEKRERWGVLKEHVMINPKLSKREGQQEGADGCLSLPGLVIEDMKRDERLHVKYQDLNGNHHELDATERFAHVIQHEYDHLEGILFFDRLPKADKETFMDEHREALLEMQREAKAFLRELKENPQANFVKS